MGKNKKNKSQKKADAYRLSAIMKKKKNSLVGIRENPFEVKMNRMKNNVLNKKLKNHKGLPGVSRAAARKKRTKTLLAEMKASNNMTLLQDRRIGAGDINMTPEEKELERLKQHHKYKNKKSIFNLSESDNIQLTHNGKLLSEVNLDYDGGFGEDDDNTEAMEKFGGADFMMVKPASEMTKLEEVIAVRKEENRQKYLNKEKNEDLFAKLQKGERDIWKMSVAPDSETKKENKMFNDQYQEQFSILMNKFKTSRKTGNQLTQQQQALEDAKKLKKQEEDRIRRMKGPEEKVDEKLFLIDTISYKLDLSVEDDVEALSFPMTEEESKNSGDYIAEIDGDDFDFSTDDEDSGSEGESEISEEEQESSVSDQGIGGDEGSSLEHEDEYSDISDSDNEDEGVEESSLSSMNKQIQPKIKEIIKEKYKNFEFPTNYEEFVCMANICEDEGKSVALDMCVVLQNEYAPHKGKNHKQMMGELFGFSFQYLTRVEKQHLPDFYKNMKELFRLNNQEACNKARDEINRSYNESFVQQQKFVWPHLKKLQQLRAVKEIFPTSDYLHPVTTATMVYMEKIMRKCPLRTVSDVANGLYVTALCYDYVSQSGRLIPSCLNLLTCILATVLPKTSFEDKSLCFYTEFNY